MKSALLLFFSAVLLYGCGSETATTPIQKKEKKQFELYERSEMATTMLYMYEFNRQLKAKIENDEELLDFPAGFERMFEADMTDGHTRDEFFQTHTELFIEQQKAIHSNPENRVEAFNNMVKSCIECHQVKCHGPIPKIEKLYIKE